MSNPAITQQFEAALQHHRAGRLRQAELDYRLVLAREPEHVEALHHLGVIAHQSRRDDVAVDLIRRAIALQPDHAEAHCNLGNALRSRGDLAAAIAEFRRAIALKPALAEAYNNLARSEERRV